MIKEVAPGSKGSDSTDINTSKEGENDGVQDSNPDDDTLDPDDNAAPKTNEELHGIDGNDAASDVEDRNDTASEADDAASMSIYESAEEDF